MTRRTQFPPNLNEQLITFAYNLATRNEYIQMSLSNFIENFQLIFDNFEQKNSQQDQYISEIRGNFIDHKTCLDNIKQAIIDVKNDLYNIAFPNLMRYTKILTPESRILNPDS